MIKRMRIVLATSTLILCTNLSQQSIEAPKQKPPLNYTGNLTDISGKTHQVKNITIGDATRFEVYEKPATTNANPADHAIVIDLKDVTEIRPTRALPIEGKQEYLVDPKDATRKHTYMEITIVELGPEKKERSVLISDAKRISCEENSTQEERHTIAFEALQKLTIKHTQTPPGACKEAEELSQRLEQEKDKNDGVIASLKSWIHSWCD